MSGQEEEEEEEERFWDGDRVLTEGDTFGTKVNRMVGSGGADLTVEGLKE